MTSKTILILIFTTSFWFNANAVDSVERIDLGFYRNSIADLIDFGFELIGYKFDETSFVSNINIGGRSFSSISMGQAILINEQMTRLTSEKEYAGVINSRIRIEDILLGEIQLYWRPSQGPLGMILSAFKYRLGKAFVLPQAPSENPTQKIIQDFFIIKWKNANQINTISNSKVELDFIKDFALKLQEVNSVMNEIIIKGEIIRFLDRKSNKINYKLNLLTEQTGILQCLNRIETNFNPYSSTEGSYLKGRIICKTSQIQNTGRNTSQSTENRP